jgi:hypothetical protein
MTKPRARRGFVVALAANAMKLDLVLRSLLTSRALLDELDSERVKKPRRRSEGVQRRPQ